MTGTIDFTNCKKILGRAYNGANGKKIAVEYNGREYMLKFPPSVLRSRQSCPIRTVVSASI